MDMLIEQLQTLQVDPLAHDVDVIMQCYQDEKHTLDTSSLLLRWNNTYKTTQELYANICQHVSKKGMSYCLLDLMPLIDEYLDYTFGDINY